MLSELATWLQSWGQIVSGLASVLLSGTLAILYYKQHNVLRNQLEKETEAEIILEAIGVGESELKHQVAYDNQVYFRFSNIGQGRASNMTIQIVPEILSDIDAEIETVSEDLERVRDSELEEIGTEINLGGNYLEGGESDVKFAIPSHTGLFFNSEVSRSGHLSLSDLPEPLAEIKSQKVISKDNYPDMDTEKEVKYHILLEEDDNTASVVSDKPDVSELPVKSKESTREVLQTSEKREIINNAVGTVFIRIQYVLQYEDEDGERHTKDLLDRVFPSRFDVPDEILFSSGLEYRRFKLQGDKRGMIERSMYSKLSQQDDGIL